LAGLLLSYLAFLNASLAYWGSALFCLTAAKTNSLSFFKALLACWRADPSYLTAERINCLSSLNASLISLSVHYFFHLWYLLLLSHYVNISRNLLEISSIKCLN